MKTDHEILTPSQRVGGLAVVGAMLLVFGFFAWHQLTSTGFFAAQFGPVDRLALYGPILVSLIAPIVRAVSGQRNPARPFQAATNLSLALGSLWLAIGFPFDFSHLSDVLPGAIRFALSWITDDIGRFVLILQVLIGVIATPLTIFTYISIRRRASAT
jgi:hypothetical protein